MRPVLATASLLALAGCLILAGCASGPEDRYARYRDYYEFRQGEVLYVLGSVDSLHRLREEGKPPERTVAAWGAGGRRLQFEATAPGLADRLMAEYDRRHGLVR